MKILVYGAGVLGSLHAALLHEAGHDVALLARGERLREVRENGVRLSVARSTDIRSVPVPVVDRPTGPYDLILILVRAHQIDTVLASLVGVEGNVLFLLNWAGGPDPLRAVLGPDRVLLGFPVEGGTMDGEVIRYRAPSFLTRLISMPVGEPDGSSTPRLERAIELFRSIGINAKAEGRMDAWLTTHAAFEVPLGQAVHAAGGPASLATNPAAVREMALRMRENIAALQSGPVPRAFGALRTTPLPILVPVLRAFLRSSAAAPLNTDTPAVIGELDKLDEQLHARPRRD